MTEHVDLVDASGQIQLEGLPRAAGFANQDPDLYIPIVVAVVFNGLDKVLIQQRSWTKAVDPGCLDFVCGVVSSGEEPIETAERESKEETCVKPNDLKLIASGINSYGRYRRLFVGQTDALGATIERPNHEVQWARVENIGWLPQMLGPIGYRAVADFESHLDMSIMHQLLGAKQDQGSN